MISASNETYLLTINVRTRKKRCLQFSMPTEPGLVAEGVFPMVLRGLEISQPVRKTVMNFLFNDAYFLNTKVD